MGRILLVGRRGMEDRKEVGRKEGRRGRFHTKEKAYTDKFSTGSKRTSSISSNLQRALNDHHHQIILLFVENRTSMKSFQSLRAPAIPLTSLHDLLVFLIPPSIVLLHVSFGLPLLLYP